MPTKHQRIAVVKDPSLAQALARVAPFYEGVAVATVVHDLAVKGAEATVRERAAQDEAIENLVALSTHGDSLDWDVLESIDERAWAE